MSPSSQTTIHSRIKNKILNEREGVRKHIILAAYLNNEPIMGNTKLQKIMFLLSDVVEDVRDNCSYDTDMYGPYSEIVDYELDDLAGVGVLRHANNKIETTPMGEDIAKELVKKERREIVELLSKYKTFLNDLPVDEVLAYVYSAYPEMTDASVVIDKMRPNMENHIMSLVKKQKISSQRAAELLNISHRHAIKKIGERDIKIFE